MKYYYLHIWGALDFDYSSIEYIDKEIHPPILGEFALEIDLLPADPLFKIWPVFFCESNLKRDLLDFDSSSLDFKAVTKISKGQNLEALQPDLILPETYWRIYFKGVPMKNHFGLWQNHYLVVSEKALEFLRSKGVQNAEADLIDIDIESYFNSTRQTFWMTLNEQ